MNSVVVVFLPYKHFSPGLSTRAVNARALKVVGPRRTRGAPNEAFAILTSQEVAVPIAATHLPAQALLLKLGRECCFS